MHAPPSRFPASRRLGAPAGAVLALVLLAACAHRSTGEARRGAPPPATANGPTPPDAAEVEDFALQLIPGGDGYVFVSNRTGEPQLFGGSLSRPREAPVQLTAEPGGLPVAYGEQPRVMAGERLAFRCGEFEFCRVSARGAAVERRKGPAGSTYQFGPFTPGAAPGAFWFEGRQEGAPGLHIFTDDFDRPGGAELVFQDASIRGWLRDVSPDGRHAAVLDLRGHDERALTLVDLRRRQARTLHPAPGLRAKVSAVVFARDGRRVLVGSDEGGDGASVLALDVDTGAVLARYEASLHRGTEVSWLALSERGDRVAVTLQAGSVSVVRVLDASTLRPSAGAAPAVPLGQGTAAAFTPDGQALLLVWATPNEGTRILAARLDGSAPEPVDRSGPSRARSPAVDAFLIRVASFDGTEIPTNVYLPRPPRAGRRPVLVHLASGPGQTAELGRTLLTDFFLRQGFAVVEPNVRGAPGFGRHFQTLDDGPRRVDALRDVGAVARWATAQPWGDPGRLVVAGASYGGFQALMALATEPSLWRAGVDLYGIADWTSFFETTNRGTAELYAREVGSPASDGELLASISPLRQIASIRAPVLVYHGRKDRQVPIAQSEALVEALRRRGVPVTAVFEDGEGHGVESSAAQRELFARLEAFLADALR